MISGPNGIAELYANLITSTVVTSQLFKFVVVIIFDDIDLFAHIENLELFLLTRLLEDPRAMCFAIVPLAAELSAILLHSLPETVPLAMPKVTIEHRALFVGLGDVAPQAASYLGPDEPAALRVL